MALHAFYYTVSLFSFVKLIPGLRRWSGSSHFLFVVIMFRSKESCLEIIRISVLEQNFVVLISIQWEGLTCRYVSCFENKSIIYFNICQTIFWANFVNHNFQCTAWKRESQNSLCHASWRCSRVLPEIYLIAFSVKNGKRYNFIQPLVAKWVT